MPKGWEKARIQSLWGHFAGSLTSLWHSQADFSSYLVLILNYLLPGKISWQGKVLFQPDLIICEL